MLGRIRERTVFLLQKTAYKMCFSKLVHETVHSGQIACIVMQVHSFYFFKFSG